MTALASDPALRSAVSTFLGVAERRVAGVGQDPRLFSRALRKDNIISYGGVYFETDGETAAALRAVCERCHARGSDTSSDQDTIDYLWRAAADLIVGGRREHLPNNTSAVLTGLSKLLSTEHIYINNNHVIRLASGIPQLVIGPVRAIRSHDLASKLFSQNPGVAWVLTGEAPNDGVISLRPGMTPVCWEVRVRAAPRRVQGRAEELIALALSLLRLSMEAYPPLCPGVGEVETSSLSASRLENTSVILEVTCPPPVPRSL